MQPYVHPSVPKSPKSGPAPLGPSTRDNLPPRPDYANLNPRRPSDTWLNSLNPGWMDGASNPPIFFHSAEDIVMTMLTWNPTHPMFNIVPSDTSVPPPSYPGDLPASAPVSAPVAPVVPAPTAAAGYQVSVLVQYTAADMSKPGLRSKPAVKQIKSTKLAIIDINGMDRCAFIKSILDVHDYGDEYSPGVNRGPPFKISWTGSSGGRGGAPTIETDAEFNVVVESLKKKTAPAVVVELNLDQMDGYRVMKKRVSYLAHKPLIYINDANVELMYGTKVPRVDDYTPQDQLHGAMIMKLDAKWACEKHHGENGDIGHCWIDPNGNHTGLNMRKKKMWASAIITVAVEIPLLLWCSQQYPPLLQNLAPKGDPLKTPPRSTLPVAFPTTPKKLTGPLSPIPTASSELHVCLDDFLKLKGINLLEAESALAALSLTPDIIANVPIERLGEVTGAVEGHLWGLQAFCRQWSARLDEKKRRLTLVSS
ncbi:hypothetical protein B0H14DRAFT_2352800 [Mycena olivaceomarginata]|nr:hypothetical protein B0H14DRAFT_2352800 [Mycena olivaceomarginata]